MADKKYKIAEPFGLMFNTLVEAKAYAIELYGEKARCGSCLGVKYIGNFMSRANYRGQSKFGFQAKCRNCNTVGRRDSRRKIRCMHCGQLTYRDSRVKVLSEEKRNGIRKQGK